MGNFALGFDNQIDNALIAFGSWQADYPSDNLKDYRVTKKARTVDTTFASTQVGFLLVSAMHIGMVALMGTNASVNAAFRVRLYSDTVGGTVIYDSGVLQVYPSGTMAFGSIPWGAPNWWTAQPLPAEISRFQNNVVHVLTNAMWAQTGLIEIFDTGNPDGYFQAGRLFVGSLFQPQVNPVYGKTSRNLSSRSTVTRAKDGTPYKQAERPDFSMPFALDSISQIEAMKALDLQAIADIFGEVLVMEDPTDILYAFRRQIFGRLKQLDPIQFPMVARYATAFQVEGTL